MATMTVPALASPAPLASMTDTRRNGLRGIRKAAILMTLLDDEGCAAVLRRLSEDQVHDVTREITRLNDVSEDDRRAVLEELLMAQANGGALHSGGIEYATSVLMAAFGPEAGKRIVSRVMKSLGLEVVNMDSLQRADPQALAKVVHGEHPQTIALILSHVGPSHAAKLLSSLPAATRAEVARRMASLDQISPEVVNKIAKTISAKLRLLGETSLETYGGVRAVADVLNRVEAKTGEEILEHIAAKEPTLGQAIRNLMFVFEDLLNVDEQAIKALMAKVDRKMLVTALKGATPRLKELFTSSMSERAAQMLAEDMEALGPVRIRNVEEAQQGIIQLARQMEAAGEVSLRPSSGDRFVV